jgi:hypothetical protein
VKARNLGVTEVGALLLEQHTALRTKIGRCATLSRRLRDGEPVGPQLATELVRLREAFTDHNELEEEMLEPFLAKSDAWSQLRIDRMLDEHAAEHAAFFLALEGTIEEVAHRFVDFARQIDAHMAMEEETFLSAKVLDAARKRLG